MALPVIANVLRCGIVWTSSTGLTAVNVLHFLAPGKTPAQLVTALNARATAAMFNTISSTAAASAFQITPLDGVSATYLGNPNNWKDVTAGSEFVPAMCAIVKLTTALRGRRYRGRIFLPFTTEAVQTNGYLNGAQVGSVTTAWQNFRTNMATDGFTLVIASYLGHVATPVTAVQVEDKLGTQRRRQDRRRNA